MVCLVRENVKINDVQLLRFALHMMSVKYIMSVGIISVEYNIYFFQNMIFSSNTRRTMSNSESISSFL